MTFDLYSNVIKYFVIRGIHYHNHNVNKMNEIEWFIPRMCSNDKIYVHLLGIVPNTIDISEKWISSC